MHFTSWTDSIKRRFASREQSTQVTRWTDGRIPSDDPEGDLFMLNRMHTRHTRIVFAACCVWIAVVSVHDAVLVVMHREVISDFEQNPLGQWLIRDSGDGVRRFFLTKLAGTAAACTILVRFQRCRPELALKVAIVVACFQALLLIYLQVR